MFLYFFAFALLVLIWGVALWFSFSWWIPSVATGLVLISLGGVLLFRRWKARRASAKLEAALSDQAAHHARTVRPDLHAEMAEVQQEFERAVDALKASKLNRRGSSALYALPWYVIIGPPGVGKTTALRSSGLNFPYLSKHGGGVRGVGGTRHCDWWLTNEAVILDTAGRWTTNNDDREEWIGFLHLLEKYRPRKPLNGVIVTASVDSLGNGSEQEVADLARQIRTRLDETMSELRMSLPVYVLFTKCDLIPGFAETFGDLSRSDRGQIWGFTLPLSGKVQQPGLEFEQRFERLVDATDNRLLRRLADERRTQHRELIYTFPQQMRELKNSLSRFIEHLFEEDVFRETPSMRGAYFASGTQEGRPIDRVMGRMAQAFGIEHSLPAAQPVIEQKSYFLRDVFRDVIFADATVAVRSPAERRRQRRIRYSLVAASATLSLAWGAASFVSWNQNRDLLRRMDTVVDRTAGSLEALKQAPTSPAVVPPSGLQTLHALFRDLEHHRDEGPPWTMRMGMYRGHSVFPALRDLYVGLLRRRVVEPVFRAELERLEEFSRRYEASPDEQPPVEAYRSNFERLKGHLLLSVPREATEPSQTSSSQTFLTRYLARHWAVASSAPAQAHRRLAGYVEPFVRAQTERETLLFRRDRDVVAGSREALSRVIAERVAVDAIVQQFSDRSPMTVKRLVGTTVPWLRGRRTVHAAFTQFAWDSGVREMLNDPARRLLGERWVLADFAWQKPSSAARAEQFLQVRKEYFRRYTDQWKEFVRGLHTVPPRAGNAGALRAMQDLTRGDPSPLSRLFDGVKKNITLTQSDASASGETAAKEGKSSKVEQLPGEVTKKTEALVAAFGGADTTSKNNNRLQKQEHQLAEQLARQFQGFLQFGVAETKEEGAPSATPLAVYEEQLLFLRDALQNHLDGSSDSDELTNRLQVARTSAQGLIAEQEVGWRPVFESILWPPIDGASMSFAAAAASGSARGWCSDVVTPFAEGMKGRYPYDPQGSDLALSDFADFYRPNDGILWSHYQERLKEQVEQEGSHFVFRKQLGRSAAEVMQRRLLRFLDTSLQLTKAFFPRGSSEPKVVFDVRILPSPGLASQVLSIGGQSFEYHNGPEHWQRMTWPGEDAGKGARIEVRGARGTNEALDYEGEWGFFRLLESGRLVSKERDQVFRVSWRIRGRKEGVLIDFKPTRANAPFLDSKGSSKRLLGLLRRDDAEVPAEIVTSRRMCPSAG